MRTRPQVYVAWLALAILGFVGYLLTESRYSWVGVALLAVYGLSGFDGLTHYLVAPVSAHTAVMNATILLEAVTAAVLLMALLRVSGTQPT